MAKPAKPPGPPNNGPTANNDTISIETVNTSVLSFLINPADLLANDIVQNGNKLSITAAQGTSGGTVQILPTGQLQVVPTDPFKPSTTFNYTINDGHGGTSSAVATVNYQVANSPPVAADDTFVFPGLPTTSFLLSSLLLANDKDANQDTLRLVGIGQVSNPNVGATFFNDPTFLTEPAVKLTIPAGFKGAINFDYIVADSHNAFDTGNVFINLV